MDVRILGHLIGTASGWDQTETLSLQFSDFEPSDLGTALGFTSTELLEIDFENGVTGVPLDLVQAEPRSLGEPDDHPSNRP